MELEVAHIDETLQPAAWVLNDEILCYRESWETMTRWLKWRDAPWGTFMVSKAFDEERPGWDGESHGQGGSVDTEHQRLTFPGRASDWEKPVRVAGLT